MNNSKIIFDNLTEEEDIDRISFLQKQQGELSQIIEAINRVEINEDWQKLKRLVLDGVVITLERQLSNEASRKEVNAPELYRLQGQLVWAKKYADLKKLGEFFKQSLENIKLQLKHE